MLRILTALALLISVNFSYSQTTVETPIPNEQPIEFKASDGSLDGTMIKRYNGNALRIRYANALLVFDALTDHGVQIRNSADQSKIMLSPSGDSYFNGGFLGLGTITPTQKLDVVGGNIRISKNAPILEFNESDNNSYSWYMVVDAGSWSLRNNGLNISNHALTADNTGNIGINKFNPQEKLHVDGNIAIENNRYIKFYNNAGVEDGTGIIRGGGNSLRIKYNASNMFFDALSDQPIGVTNSQNENVIQLHPNGHSYFNGGSLSIGLTSSLGYQLAVNGTIGAKEVIVENTSAWPDYVFKPEYQLASLDEVKKHIDEKGHLLNIPSAKEVDEKGISLGEMNRLLLEKVEELTLYMLEQNTQLKAQQDQIIVLTEEINSLKTK